MDIVAKEKGTVIIMMTVCRGLDANVMMIGSDGEMIIARRKNAMARRPVV